MSRLIDFQLGSISDHKGRFISEIWELDNFSLEHTHDYIQWLFPTASNHKFNQFAPTLTTKEQIEFQESVELQSVMRDSLAVMLTFFGLKWQQGDIVPAVNLSPRKQIWLKPGGHNHLRISRIINSLTLCGQPDLAEVFCTAMIRIGCDYGYVTEKSTSYWVKATQERSLPPSN